MKLQLSLTRDEQRRVARNAHRHGFDIPRYIQFIIVQETQQLTSGMLRKLRRAMKEYDGGKTAVVSSASELLR